MERGYPLLVLQLAGITEYCHLRTWCHEQSSATETQILLAGKSEAARGLTPWQGGLILLRTTCQGTR